MDSVGSMKPSKYIVVYNGKGFPCDSVEDAAVKLFGLKVVKSPDGLDWDVVVNGKVVAHYLRNCTGRIGMICDGLTKYEVLRDFIRKNTYPNLHWYHLVNGVC